MQKVVEINARTLKIGDFITVDKYLLGSDRSYIGDVLEILAIDGNFVHVKDLSFFGLMPVLDTRVYVLRHLSPEFVNSVLSEKGKRS